MIVSPYTILGTEQGELYIRYSKVHPRGQTFYGLRQKDLQKLEGQPSVICFLWQDQKEPIILPYSDFEEVFHSLSPASDGQYKVQIFLQDAGSELYIANAGRFNIEAFFGWEQLNSIIDKSQLTNIPVLSHEQVQTLLGSIGAAKGYNIWIPKNDRGKLDWNLTKQFGCDAEMSNEYHRIEDIISEIDVLWIERGAGTLERFSKLNTQLRSIPGSFVLTMFILCFQAQKQLIVLYQTMIEELSLSGN